MPRKLISIYCDGSSNGLSGGPIGFGWLVTDWEEIICAGSEGEISGTNNTAELKAAIHGLRAVLDRGLHTGNEVELVSDSTYTLNLASGHYQPNKHLELVLLLKDLYRQAGARPRWIKGHSGDAMNDKADQLAKAGRDKYSIGIETKKRRRSRRRLERRRKRAIVKEYCRRMYGHQGVSQ